MPKVTPEHQESRRVQILEAAVQCFSSKGFHKTTMRDIITQSGLSSGAIYSYFNSKTQIINAIAKTRHQREVAMFQEALQKQNPKESLQFLLEHFLGSLMTDEAREDRLIGVQMWAEAIHNPEILSTVKDGINKPLHYLTKLIIEWQKKGEFSGRVPPETAARSMIALFHGYILQMTWDDSVNISEYIRGMTAVIDLISEE